MAKQIIEPLKFRRIPGASQAIKVGNTIYVSGQAGADREGNITEGDCGAQAEQVFANMKHVLEAAGATMQDVVMLHFYFACNIPENMPKINDAFRKYFEEHLPASTAVQVASLFSPAILLEVEAVAVIE